MTAYRKKPVVIEAWKIEHDTEQPEWVKAEFRAETLDWCPSGEGLWINTLEGCMVGSEGDMLIRGVKGEFYPCKPDIFALTHEPATHPQSPASPLPEAAEPVAIIHDDGYWTHKPGRDPFPRKDGKVSMPVYAAASPVAQAPAQVGEVERDQAYAYALNLAKTLWSQHFKTQAPNWEPLDDTLGLLTQIDNMVAGITLATQPLAAPVQQEAEALARHFHDTYERLAPDFGYETKPSTKVFDAASTNGRLMIATCGEILAALATPPAQPVLAPVVREPLTASPTQFIAAHTYLRGCEIDMSGAELDNLLRIFGIQATTGEQSHE